MADNEVLDEIIGPYPVEIVVQHKRLVCVGITVSTYFVFTNFATVFDLDDLPSQIAAILPPFSENLSLTDLLYRCATLFRLLTFVMRFPVWFKLYNCLLCGQANDVDIAVRHHQG